jgi:hypothetical protein
MSRAEPTQLAPGPGIPVPSSAVLAVEGRAATTIRLRPAAAAALNSAWLYRRMHVNPKLSYPEFASEIVRLGLASFERQAKRSLPATASGLRRIAEAPPDVTSREIQLRFCACPAGRQQEQSVRLRLCIQAQLNASGRPPGRLRPTRGSDTGPKCSPRPR